MKSLAIECSEADVITEDLIRLQASDFTSGLNMKNVELLVQDKKKNDTRNKSQVRFPGLETFYKPTVSQFLLISQFLKWNLSA